MKAETDHELMKSCGTLLIEKQLTIAFAESATAGRISGEFSLISNAGKFLKGGVVCYDAGLKTLLLGVADEQLKKFTPESEEVTRLITFGLQQLIPADIHIGCTGLTGPGGSETPEKPVGTMFLYGVMKTRLLFNDRILFQGTPEEITIRTVEHVARLLIKMLSGK